MSNSRFRVGVLVVAGMAASLVPMPFGRVAAGPAAALACPRTERCGSGCTATLSIAFCVRVISYSGGVSVPAPGGRIKIGPTLKISCRICDCWYIYRNSIGNLQFKRTSDASCAASLDGVELIKT